MNERIKELADEAGYKHPDAVGKCEDYAYFSHEKFAELIVKECLSYMEPGDIDFAKWKIKEHFGVEE